MKADGTDIYCSSDNAEILADVFDSKQCSESLLLLQSRFPEPKMRSVAFRSKTVKTLPLELDSRSGNDNNGIFPIFPKMTADFFALKIATTFHKLFVFASFP